MRYSIEITNHNMNVPKDTGVAVGWFEDQKYDDDTSIAKVAQIQEYGLKEHIPQRPFMRTAIHKNSNKWIDLLLKQMKKCIENNYNPDIAVKQVGEVIKSDIQDSIINGDWAPNAPSTIKRKGLNAPLRDTKIMLHSIQSRSYKELDDD